MSGGGTGRQLTAAAGRRRDDDDDDDYIDNDVDKPIFRPAPTNITVSPGDRASLKCRVDNLGTKTVGYEVYSVGVVQRGFLILYIFIPVSYTHLTLPTNREV